MEGTGGAAPGKGGTHEQDHSHPEAQCPAVLRGGAGICGAVRCVSGLSAVGTAGGAGRGCAGLCRGQKDLPAPGGGDGSALPYRCGRCGCHADRDAAAAGHPPCPERSPAGPAALRCHDPDGKGGPLHCGNGGSHPRQGKAGAAVRQLLSARCRERAAAVRQAGKAGGAGRECRLHPCGGGAQCRLHCHGV